MIWERRADMVSAIGAAFVVGWVSCSGYYSLAHLWQEENQLVKVEKLDIPQLKALVRCEHKAHQIATDLAKEANATATDVDVAAIPECQK